MPLEADIIALRDRSRTELAAAHDHHVHQEAMRDFMEARVTSGEVFYIDNPTTGSRTHQDELVAKGPEYARRLAVATLNEFVSLFESFFFDLVRLWLTAYPRSLGAKKIDFSVILDNPDIDTLTEIVVGHEINQVMYAKPAEWFRYLDSKVTLRCPTSEQIDRLTEVKASRDIHIHNRGIANATYVAKAGKQARYAEEQFVELPDDYLRGAVSLMSDIARDVATAAASGTT